MRTFTDLLEQRKYEIRGILRIGDSNPERVDGGWNLEGFLLHFETEHDVTVEALNELITENMIYVDGLSLFRRVDWRRELDERSSSTC